MELELECIFILYLEKESDDADYIWTTNTVILKYLFKVFKIIM